MPTVARLGGVLVPVDVATFPPALVGVAVAAALVPVFAGGTVGADTAVPVAVLTGAAMVAAVFVGVAVATAVFVGVAVAAAVVPVLAGVIVGVATTVPVAVLAGTAVPLGAVVGVDEGDGAPPEEGRQPTKGG